MKIFYSILTLTAFASAAAVASPADYRQESSSEFSSAREEACKVASEVPLPELDLQPLCDPNNIIASYMTADQVQEVSDRMQTAMTKAMKAGKLSVIDTPEKVATHRKLMWLKLKMWNAKESFFILF